MFAVLINLYLGMIYSIVQRETEIYNQIRMHQIGFLVTHQYYKQVNIPHLQTQQSMLKEIKNQLQIVHSIQFKMTLSIALKYFMPNWFCMSKGNKDNQVRNQKQMIIDHLCKQMVLFRDSWLFESLWRKLIDEGDVDNLYSNKGIFLLRCKAKYLFCSLDSIIQLYQNNSITECISVAIMKIK